MVPSYALIEIERKPRFAWIAGRQGRRLRFVLEDGTAVLEPFKRVLYRWEGESIAEDGAGNGAAAALAQLRERARAASDSSPGLDAAALHARIGAGEGWPFERIAASLLGEQVSGWARAALYLALLRETEHFRPTRGRFVARSGEEMRQQARRAEALRLHQAWLGRVAGWRAALEGGESLAEADPGAREFLAQLESLLAFETRSPHWKTLARPLALLAHDWPGNRATLRRWLEVAGAWHGWGAIWRLGAGVPDRFGAALEARAEALATERAEARGRMDYRGLPTYSLDSAGTRDFDDAITILTESGDELEIAAHVADVSRALGAGDPLFEEAARRAATLYTPDAVVPMLPGALSQGRFSLIAGEDREAMTFRFRLGAGGARLLAIEPSVVRLTRNLDYAQGEALIAADRPGWGRLSALCERLGTERASRGAHMPERAEIRIDIADPERIRLTRVDRHDPAHRLVEELAILVNGETGRYCRRHRLPAYYRVQGRAETGSAPAARFSMEGGEHAGVACERYVQVTSPIRRFPDLIMQGQIAAQAARGRPEHTDRAQLEAWLHHAEQRLATYQQLERRVENYWKRLYLAQNLGLEMLGVVRRRDAAARVWLDDVLLEADGHLAPSVTEGWRGRFRVIASDPDQETVEVVMVEKP
jgi:hypothetical protein